jgi:hypothetical protein
MHWYKLANVQNYLNILHQFVQGTNSALTNWDLAGALRGLFEAPMNGPLFEDVKKLLKERSPVCSQNNVRPEVEKLLKKWAVQATGDKAEELFVAIETWYRNSRLSSVLGLLGKFTEPTDGMIERMERLGQEGFIRNHPATEEAYGTVLNAMKAAPSPYDIPIVVEDPFVTAQNWKKYKSLMVEGAPVKFKFKQAGTIGLGRIGRVQTISKSVHGKNYTFPIVTIRQANTIGEDGNSSQRATSEINIDFSNPQYLLWIDRPIEQIPISEFTGTWVNVTDSEVANFVKRPTTPGILLKTDGQEATVKIIAHGSEWIFEVPASEVHPSKSSPQWGIGYSQRKHRFTIGDVVTMGEDPNRYLVKAYGEPGQVIAVSESAPASGQITLDTKRLKYVGRFDFSGINTAPNFRSKALRPVQPQAPQLQPRTRDTE